MTHNNSLNDAGEALGFGFATKSIQTFASEVARLSKETVDETTLLVEKLRGAKTLEDVVALQTSFVQQSFAKYADYTRRFGELFAAVPLELAKQSHAALQKTSEAVTKATEHASQQLQKGAEQASQQVQHAAGQTAEYVEQAPAQFNQNYQNNDQNYNNNQNYNNQNY
ncbi:MAG: phasin family protein [Beijerinckiaceae bacterium]|nr:phasin family protein [Beijerinckiaceae bacterium]